MKSVNITPKIYKYVEGLQHFAKYRRIFNYLDEERVSIIKDDNNVWLEKIDRYSFVPEYFLKFMDDVCNKKNLNFIYFQEYYTKLV